MTFAIEPVSRQNNFDLLRLVAALMVVFPHMTQHKLLTDPGVEVFSNTLYSFFPGVPVFFIISGFLITNSWLHSSDWKTYAKSRFLRIYPALFVSTCVTAYLVYAYGHMEGTAVNRIVRWFIGQFTLGFAYHTPGTLKGFSGDMPNGSIWTLPVEMNFYMLAPLILLPTVRAFYKPRYLVPGGLMLLSLLLVFFDRFGIHISHPDLRHMALYHFWWFGLGMMACLDFKALKPYLEGKFLYYLALHVVVWWFFKMVYPLDYKLAMVPSGLTLAPLVLSAAYTAPGLAHKLLRGQDFSYGIYLFHRPWIHALTGIGVTGLTGVGWLIGLTGVAAVASWYVIEKPALRLKGVKGFGLKRLAWWR